MAENVKIPGEFDDDNDFWKHPNYNKWEANRFGIVRNVENKKDVGHLNTRGYFIIYVSDESIKKISKT